ncbi:serine/threonine protein kinase [Roseimicrobium gellanilyticum]|uniref:non-specific serine/threonine protein kinase n=1 Tax=Roseimicrobium gellanilyticum TaxID=748857 RepID=A0A366H0F2_9BACT|nr:protein kinase [Roseimicrobium gellanilyticum]RBP35316.1 serine/threonine protein kinase [Roseimicrobium gellanilyticum]
MTPSKTCPECGALLPADAHDALCPACLLSHAARDLDVTQPAAGPQQSAESLLQHLPCDFGGYHVLRLLGRGGMGTVYEAEQRTTGRRVALKILGQAPDTAEMRQRFLREGRLAASVSHPNTVYIFGTEEIEGAPVIVMELADGGTLKDELKRRGPLPVREAVDAVLQIIDGLESAHTAGVLHRDVKPANCFLTPEGVVKVGDFGLSVSTLARTDTKLTASGMMLGTPSFAPPEQLRGDDLDARADIYSVGATLYALLTGRVPFEGENVIHVVTRVLDAAPKPPLERRADLPPDLSQVIMRCLAKKREDRFATYAALREALLPFSSQVRQPAPLGLRFVGKFLNETFVMIPEMVIGIWMGWDAFDKFLADRGAGSFALLLGFMAVYILYYTITEGIWGTSPGKALCGLRVVRLDGAVPGIPRALVRALCWTLGLNLGYLFIFFTTSAEEYRAAVERQWSPIWFWIFTPLWLLLLVTMRRSNGYATVQDLLSGTRVVVRPKTPVRPRLAVVVEEAAPSRGERLGPYLINQTKTGAASYLEGYDDVLRRRVWIRSCEGTALPISEPRRHASRATRLRWLGGVRAEGGGWDAYEAPQGRALIYMPPQSQPWSTVRHWLQDLAQEMDAALRDGTLPASLSFAHVWLTADGRAVLLDDPWQDHGHVMISQEDETSHHVSNAATAEKFLHAVATRLLDPASIPLHAQDFLSKLSTGAMDRLSFVQGNLQSLMGRSAAISRRRRFASLALLPGALLTCLMLFGFALWELKRPVEAFQQQHSAHAELPLLVTAYEAMREGPPHWTDKQMHDAARIVAAHKALIEEPKFAEITADVFTDEQRDLARAAVRDNAGMTGAELESAKTQLNAQMLEIGTAPHDPRLLFYVAGVVMVFAATVNAVSMLLLGTSAGFRMFGIALVNRHGKPASRLRLFWRSLVAWVPLVLLLMITGAAHQHDKSMAPQLAWLFASLFTLWVAAGVWAIVRPMRGIHDWVSGTRLIPH